MIVYGDPGRDERLDVLTSQLVKESERLVIGVPSLEDVREVLIRAGELEQAVSDAFETGPLDGDTDVVSSAFTCTTLAAALFDGVAADAPRDQLGAAARRLHAAACSVPALPTVVRAKVPEGFAFYALYPDSYRGAARRWAEHHPRVDGRTLLVLGIRSIGTTLSAVLAESIRAVGWDARRATLRPTGHPYRREARGSFPEAGCGIVVDEGPGLSGSSMMAGVDLLERSGIRDIALAPAHAHGPGAAASALLRARWDSAAIYPALTEADGLPSILPREARASGEATDSLVEDIGTGRWRRLLYDDERAWPDVVTALERPKFLVRLPGGKRLFFKFGGLSPAPPDTGPPSSLARWLARRAGERAVDGAAVPSRVTHGYLVREWIEGWPARASSASSTLLEHMGAYVARAAGPPLTEGERRTAEERLVAMVSVNVEAALDATASRAAADRVRPAHRASGELPSYGDGRMAPHEWIRARDGRLVKTDAEGHEVDHTWVGRQPVLWDLAGAIAEWGLDEAGARYLLRGYEGAGGQPVSDADLDGFVLAYAAHRAGQAGLFRTVERDPAERERMEKSFERWRARLVERLVAPLGRRT